MGIVCLTMLGLFCIIPQSFVVEDRAETIEHNHYYDTNGEHIFDQWIFYDRDGEIIDWRMCKGPSIVDGNTLLFYDGQDMRRVKFGEHRHTWTQYDPELAEREKLPKESRRGLTNPTPH